MSSTTLPRERPGHTDATSVMAAPYRATTLGMVARVSLNAFETLAPRTRAPQG